MLGGDPYFTGLFQYLLALRMDTGIQGGDGAGPLGSGDSTILQLGEQGFERFHGESLSQTVPVKPCSAHGKAQQRLHITLLDLALAIEHLQLPGLTGANGAGDGIGVLGAEQ